MDMETKEKSNFIREHLADYMSLYHPEINLAKPFRCLNPNHRDSTASMIYNPPGAYTASLYCFGCGCRYNTFDLIAFDNNVTEFRDAYKIGCNIFFEGDAPERVQPVVKPRKEEKPPTDYTEYFQRCRLRFHGSPAERYVNDRGISTETARRLWIGYDPEFWFNGKSRALVIPVSRYSFTARNIRAGGDRFRTGGRKTALFNVKALKESDSHIFIVEGELDAISIIEAGGQAIAIRGAQNNKNFISAVLANKPKAPLILLPDNDETGEKSTEERAELLEKNKIPFVVRRLVCEGCKDSNDVLRRDRNLLKRFIESEGT